MGVMSIRIDDDKRKLLKIISSIEGKPMSKIIGELLDDYIRKNKDKLKSISEKAELLDMMKLSENSFKEWDNEEDEIYNNL